MITLVDYYAAHPFPEKIREFVKLVDKAWPTCHTFFCGTLIALKGLNKRNNFAEEAIKLGFVTRKLHLWRIGIHQDYPAEKDEVIWMYDDNKSRPIEDDEFLIWDDYNSH